METGKHQGKVRKNQPMQEITVTELAAQLAPVIVDVREDDEYRGGHAPDTIHIPLGELMERTSEIPDDGPIYVICAVGGRSARAVQYLSAQGFDAVNVAGGTIGWHDAGLPIVTH
jgi:rhodanese-related sulfurtransferase